MRDLIYYVASTLDGFIAHHDGSFDGWPWDDDYGVDLFETFPETLPAHLRTPENASVDNKWFDVVLMGRRTYEVGLKEGLTNPYPTMQQYVFSRTMQQSPDANVTLVADNVVDVVQELKQGTGKAIWLCGGAELASTLFAADLIDQMIVKLNPVLFGSGVPLFAPVVKQAALQLTRHKSYESGHVVLYYRLKR
ncbi:MAG: dihydrofolate reductase [Chloroflexales bacterium]|nr:dihydrofolate reductase [Chloroflexales bacterium]